MRIVKPNKLIHNGRTILYDVFITYNNRLAIIYNPGIVYEDEIVSLRIFADKELICQDQILIDHPSKTGELVGIKYYMPADKIRIEFGGKEYNFTPNRDDEQSKGLVASTLFNHDHHYVAPHWIEYNLSIGIDQFILYTNDKIDDKILSLLRPYEDKITLVEWDFQYFINKCHGAQVQQLNHCLYMFNFDQVAFVDIDEFICFADKYKNLKDLIAQHNQYDVLFLDCKWTYALTKSDKPSDILRSKVIKNKTLSQYEAPRLKNIAIHRENMREQLVHGASHKTYLEFLPETAHFRHYMQLNSSNNRLGRSNDLLKLIQEPIEDKALYDS